MQKAIVVTPQGPDLYREYNGKLSYMHDGEWKASAYHSLEDLRGRAVTYGFQWVDLNEIQEEKVDEVYRIVWSDTHEPWGDATLLPYTTASRIVRNHNLIETRKATSQKGVVQWQAI